MPTISLDEQKAHFEELKFYADSNCKDCYGRGYKGVWNDRLLPCNCLIKNINQKLKDEGKPTLEQDFIRGWNESN